MSDRSNRGQLQQLVGELGTVQGYRWRVDDMHRPQIGWWLTPAPAANGCSCGVCAAAREGRDVDLGSITRTAFYEAGRLALEHQR